MAAEFSNSINPVQNISRSTNVESVVSVRSVQNSRTESKTQTSAE